MLQYRYCYVADDGAAAEAQGQCLSDGRCWEHSSPRTGYVISRLLVTYTWNQCSGSMKFWGGSGSADPCLWLMVRIRILDPDPAIFVIDLQNASKKQIFHTIFSAYYFSKVHLLHFSKINSQKESQNSRNQGFSYYFCMMIEGSGFRSRTGSGPIPLTSGSGSGSGRPENMWIRIRIRNTAWKVKLSWVLGVCM